MDKFLILLSIKKLEKLKKKKNTDISGLVTNIALNTKSGETEKSFLMILNCITVNELNKSGWMSLIW